MDNNPVKMKLKDALLLVAEKNGDRGVASAIRRSRTPFEDYYCTYASSHGKARREKKRDSYIRVQDDLVEPASFDCPFG